MAKCVCCGLSASGAFCDLCRSRGHDEDYGDRWSMTLYRNGNEVGQLRELTNEDLNDVMKVLDALEPAGISGSDPA